MRYVVDIDGTICTPGKGEGRYTEAVSIPDRIAKINKLYDQGHYIVYLTARGMGRFGNSRMLSHKTFYNFTYDQLRSTKPIHISDHRDYQSTNVYTNSSTAQHLMVQ